MLLLAFLKLSILGISYSYMPGNSRKLRFSAVSVPWRWFNQGDSGLGSTGNGRPEVMSFDAGGENPSDNEEKVIGGDDDVDCLGDEDKSGQFRLKPKKAPTILNGELPPPPVFRSKRAPTPITDNLVVVGLTVLTLALTVALFLFLNKVREASL